MKRTQLKRKTPMKRVSKTLAEKIEAHAESGKKWRSELLRKASISRKPGKKVKAWDAARKKLKVAFQEVGITSCELQLFGCMRDFGLSFAHAEKRRFIVTPAQLNECAISCASCHLLIEALTHEEMAMRVREIIASRETQPQLTAR